MDASLPVADLHCDLLLYLQTDPARTPFEPASRCSIPQHRQGNVHLQVAAIFCETRAHSTKSGLAQALLFSDLLLRYPEHYQRLSPSILTGRSDKISLVAAIENASSFCLEDEPLTDGLERLDALQKAIGPLLYVSLTWNGDNRFGGGVGSERGLSRDGEILLQHLDHHGIAVDLSHTSDALANGIFDYIDKQNLQIPVIASHSNFRAIRDEPRNLPDYLAKEIFRRGGLVGLNLYKKFVHQKSPEGIVRHLAHGLELGGEGNLCFGADWFCDTDDYIAGILPPGKEGFFSEYENASGYPYLLNLFHRELGLDERQLTKVAHGNLHTFLAKHLY